jgi:hypothetical protein
MKRTIQCSHAKPISSCDECYPIFLEETSTTQSDNTLEELRADLLIPLLDYGTVAYMTPEDFTAMRASVVEVAEKHIKTAQLDLLTRLEAEPTIADLFPTHPENNPDGYEDMVSVVKWYKSKLQAERAKLKEVK